MGLKRFYIALRIFREGLISAFRKAVEGEEDARGISFKGAVT
jgi:hypothetical protein